MQSLEVELLLAFRRNTRNLKKDIVTVNEDTKVAAFLKLLANNEILSAPVVAVVDGRKVIIGSLSVHDILTYMYNHNMFENGINLDPGSPKQLLFTEVSIKTVMEELEVKQPIFIQDTEPLANLLWLFAYARYHRVLVGSTDLWIDKDDNKGSGGFNIVILGFRPISQSVTIVSQHDVGAYLQDIFQHKSNRFAVLCAGLFDVPLYEFVKDKPRVLGIKENQPIIDAYNLMYVNQIHAVPVLNENGEIVATVSEKSLKGLNIENFASIQQPPPISKNTENLMCDVSQTVGDAVEKMLNSNAHHVWIIGQDKDENSVIEGVLTWTDVMQLFVSRQF